MARINAEYRSDAKKKIIAAALEVAAERGWDAVTLEAIAQKVGVTKGALYVYFENSEALLREVTREVFRNIRAQLEATLVDDEEVRRTIRGLAEVIFEQQEPYASIFCQLPVRLPQDRKYREEFIRIFDGTRVLIRDYLSRMQKEGKLPPGADPDTAANAILALILGLRIRSIFLGMDILEAKRVWIDSVERILTLR
jgi:AcrR family transcriptional regulator